MQYTLRRIAALVEGEVRGDAELTVTSLHSLASATAQSLSFYAGSGTDLSEQLNHTRAGAVLIAPDHEAAFSGNKIIVAEPYLAYARVSGLFAPPDNAWPGIHHTACIAEDATLETGVSVGPMATVGPGASLGSGVCLGSGVHIGAQAVIGPDTRIEAGVIIGARVEIGRRCRISPGVVIGASGFGYVQHQGSWQRIEQLGRVLIGNDVDIGANTTIDRGALDNTVIENGVKLDNQIQVAHNVRIGEHTIIAGCAGIAGSARIGKRCQIGARGAILGHLEIADDVIIFANSTVTRDIRTPGGYSSVLPVEPARSWRRILARIKRLDKRKTGKT